MFGLPDAKKIGVYLAAILALFSIPLLTHDAYILHIMIISMIFAIFASSWNLAVGFGGLKSFGHQAFFGIAGYASALLSMRSGLPLAASMVIGSVLAALVGVVLALPVLKIRSMAHVAIVTLALAEIFRLLATNIRSITGGESGLAGIPSMAVSSSDRSTIYYIAAISLVATVGVIIILVRSRFGLVLTAVKDSEEAAESLGVVTSRYKIAVFLISALLVGFAGTLYAHYVQVLTPRAFMGVDIMIAVLGMVLVGGIGTIFGPIIGAFGLTILVELLADFSEVRFILYGLLIMLVMIARPAGLISFFPSSMQRYLVR